MLGLEVRARPGRRCVPHAPRAPRPRRRLRCRRDGRGRRRPRRPIRSPTRSPTASATSGCTSTRPTRARPGSAPSSVRVGDRGRARRLARRQPAQVDAHRHGLLAASGRAGRRLPPGVHASCPEYLRVGRGRRSASARSASRSAGRFRALRLWAVLRCFGRVGPAGDDPRARPAGGAVRGLGARRARLGALRAAAVLGRLLPPRRLGRGERAAARRGRTRAARSSSRTRGSTAATSSGSRSATRGRPRPTCASAWDVLRREAAAL